MTKTKLFKLSIMILLGGFVLSIPFDALAETPKLQLQTGAKGTCADPDFPCPEGESCWLCTDYPTNSYYQYRCSSGGAIPSHNTGETCTLSSGNILSAAKKSGMIDKDITVDDVTKADAIIEGKDLNINGETISHYRQATNITAREDVQRFIDERLVESKADGKIIKGDSIQKNIDSAGAEVTNLAAKFTSALGEAIGNCEDNRSWLSKIFPDQNQTLHTVLGSSYSWSWHARDVIKNYTCPNTQATQEAIQKAIELGEQLDDAREQYKYLEDLTNYNGYVYSYYFCPKYNEDGKTCAVDLVSFDFIINEDDGTLRSITGVSQGCVPLPFKIYEAKSCLICPLMDIIYKTVQKASTNSFDKLGRPLSTLVLIGLSIWIAFMVLQNVSAMTKQDAPKFLTDLFKNSFKVIIAFYLLRNPTLVYTMIIGPILKSGFELGVSFLSINLSDVAACKETSMTIGSGGGTGVLPPYVWANLNCFIRAVQYELATSQAIGSSLMCVSRHMATGNFGAIAHALPDFMMMLTGGLIYIISFIMSLAFGFYLIDATVQLGIFGVVLPFLILCWPFEKTKSYFQTGVKIFMNSWFVYVFMGIVVNVCMTLIGESLTGGKGGFSDVEKAINGNNIKELKELLDIGYSGFLILIACCIMSIKLMQKVEDLASKFSGGLNLGIGSKIGGLAASGATGGAKAAVGFVGNRAKSAANAKVWGKEGQEKSIADMWRSGKHAAGKTVARKIQNGGKRFGSMLGKLAGHR